jgi:hypothetical protein
MFLILQLVCNYLRLAINLFQLIKSATKDFPLSGLSSWVEVGRADKDRSLRFNIKTLAFVDFSGSI